MGRDIPLGRIAGVKISMSWLVPLVGAVLTWSLAVNFLPAQDPYQGSLAYWSVGIAGTVAYFLSLLAHEMGHALMARREGIGVEGINLWLMGGVAKFEHEAETPGAELRVAGIGPVMTAIVGVVLLLFGQLLGSGYGISDLFAHVFRYIGFFNLLIAAFNLLPGVPLDGGRVLGALLWMRTDDQTGSQQLTDRVGQVLGAGLAVAGIVLAQHHSTQNGILVVVVGMFIFFSATSELRSIAGLAMLRTLRLGELMDPAPPLLPDWMSVQDLVVHAHEYLPHTAFATTGIDGRVNGLVTAETVQAIDPRLWPSLHLADVAFPLSRLQVASVDDSVLVTVQRARSGVSGRVLVLGHDGQVVGLAGADLMQRAAQLHLARTQPPPPAPVDAGPPHAWGPPRL